MAQPKPPKVQLLSPANGTTGVQGFARLQWTAADRARDYEVRLRGEPLRPEQIKTTPFTDFDYPVTAGITYRWSVRGVNKFGLAGDWSDEWTFSAYSPTPPPPEPQRKVSIFVPTIPSDETNLAWNKATVDLCAELGITEYIWPSNFYNLPFEHPYIRKDLYHDLKTHIESSGLTQRMQALKITKDPLAFGNPAHMGSITLKRLLGEPVDLLSRLSSRSGTLAPGGKVFLKVMLTPAEIGRLYGLQITTSGTLGFRWYSPERPYGKVVDGNVTGDLSLECPAQSASEWWILFLNRTTEEQTYEVRGLMEIYPDPADMRSETATEYEWLGGKWGTIGFAQPRLHPRYHEPEALQRHLDQMRNVIGEFGLPLFANGDELACMQMEAGYANLSEIVYPFFTAVAEEHAALTGEPLALWTMDYAANGYRACEGDFREFPALLTGQEPFSWVLYEWARTAANMAFLISKCGRCTVHFMIGDPLELLTAIKAEIALLPAGDQDKIDWFLYAPAVDRCTREKLAPVMAAITTI